MKSFFKPFVFAIALGTLLPLSAQSFAQSTQAPNMKFLTAEERADFNRRLQDSGVSSSRSKVTAEMNRLIQQRRLKQRSLDRQSKKSQSGAK